MASFATADDLEEYLDRPVSAPQADRILAMVSARIRSRTGQVFDLVQGDVVTLPGGRERITLPQQPVRAINSVTTQGWGEATAVTQLAGTGYKLSGGDLVWLGGGLPRIGGSPAQPYLGTVWPPEVTVDHDHGYDTYPDDVVGCCLQLAAELISAPEGDTFERIDDYARRRPDAVDTAANQALEELVKRYGRGVYVVSCR